MDSKTVAFYTQPPPDEGFPNSEAVLRGTPGSEKIWFKDDGSPHRLGELRANRDYARTLRCLIEEGPESFYTGSIARQIVQDMEKHGGLITAQDLRVLSISEMRHFLNRTLLAKLGVAKKLPEVLIVGSSALYCLGLHLLSAL
jgi:hypothetical protein